MGVTLLRNERAANSKARRAKLGAAFALAASVGWLTGGCGGSEDQTPAGSAPNSSQFPAVNGRSLEQIAGDVGIDNEIVASPAGQVFRVGENRFGFGLFTVAREQIEDAEVAIYAAHGPGGKATGPFPARSEDLTTEPAFVAETTAADPDAATVVYVSELELSARGEWRLLALIRDGDSFSATRLPSIEAGRFEGVPMPGDAAPVVETPTVEDVGGDLDQIDTRVPHDSMHEVDFADVVGEKPIVLLFATPALCQSRVCGPVVDIAEQVKSEFDEEEAAFIHMEVYRDNSVEKGLRPQLEAFNLPTEPWLFVIDERGRVSTAIEGGFSVEELRQAVEEVLRAT
jgi:hypothetical protein